MCLGWEYVLLFFTDSGRRSHSQQRASASLYIFHEICSASWPREAKSNVTRINKTEWTKGLLCRKSITIFYSRKSFRFVFVCLYLYIRIEHYLKIYCVSGGIVVPQEHLINLFNSLYWSVYLLWLLSPGLTVTMNGCGLLCFCCEWIATVVPSQVLLLLFFVVSVKAICHLCQWGWNAHVRWFIDQRLVFCRTARMWEQ